MGPDDNHSSDAHCELVYFHSRMRAATHTHKINTLSLFLSVSHTHTHTNKHTHTHTHTHTHWFVSVRQNLPPFLVSFPFPVRGSQQMEARRGEARRGEERQRSV